MVAKSEHAAGVARAELFFTLALAGALIVAGLALAFRLANGIMPAFARVDRDGDEIAGGDPDGESQDNVAR